MHLERKSGETQQDFVYRVLLSFRGQGATRVQLQEASRVPPKSLDGRLANLEADGRAVPTRRVSRPPGARREMMVWVADRYAGPGDRLERPPRNRSAREVERLLEKLDAVWEVATKNGYLAIQAVITCAKNSPHHTKKRCPACHGEASTAVPGEFSQARPRPEPAPADLPFVPDATPDTGETHVGEPDSAVAEDGSGVGGEGGGAEH